MYLNDVWYCVALTREVSREPLRRIICDVPTVFYRSTKGTVIALEDRCGHRQAPLSKGRVVGDDIQCMYHGYIYGSGGDCVHVPHQNFKPKSAAIQPFVTLERWGYVWLWRGDASQADESLIPSLPWTEQPDQRSVFFYWHVNANFQLAADNLLDESHADFLHRASIGSEAGMEHDDAKATVTCRREHSKVYCTRKLENTKLGPVAARWAATKLPITRTNTQMWEAPNTIHMLMSLTNHETDRHVHMAHIMTPETATTCHYFMNWTRDFGIDNVSYPTDNDIITEHAIVTNDDIPMVEAQQQNINAFGNPRDVAAKADVFVVTAHRVLVDAHKKAGHPIPRELQRDGLVETSEQAEMVD